MKIEWKQNPPGVCGRKWFRGGFIGMGLAGIGMVSFLSLRPTPAISTLRWMPKFIANWADRHGQFDNFPAYMAMGVPFFMIISGFRRQMWTIAILSAFIVSLELTQLAIPTRHCDVADMFWGSMGVAAAWAVCEVLKRFRITIGSKPGPAA
jgi:glycopeptide antibiotics resistance protein